MAEILHEASHCGPIGKFGINLGYIWDLNFAEKSENDFHLMQCSDQLSTILKCFQNAHIRHITHRAYTPKILCFNPIRVSP